MLPLACSSHTTRHSFFAMGARSRLAAVPVKRLDGVKDEPNFQAVAAERQHLTLLHPCCTARIHGRPYL